MTDSLFGSVGVGFAVCGIHLVWEAVFVGFAASFGTVGCADIVGSLGIAVSFPAIGLFVGRFVLGNSVGVGIWCLYIGNYSWPLCHSVGMVWVVDLVHIVGVGTFDVCLVHTVFSAFAFPCLLRQKLLFV